ncbi:hypothetical protein GGI07_003796 [Coemansia sp. Benny D115]|nr:hypothetical protein GGI07_003796 [Coemansia sp. Benny D115]
MVKERSYKILEQLDEYELQDDLHAVGDNEEGLASGTSRTHVAIPSAMDSDDGSDSEYETDTDEEAPAHTHPAAATATSANAAAAAAAAASSSAAQSSSARTNGHTTIVPNPTDGVFANMSAKPDLYLGYDDKVPTDEALPTYQDIYGPQSNSAPPYFETAVISVGDEDELLVEGLPVGSLAVFMVNMVVSTAFQVVGYMLTFLLHSSHAAKNGSLAGLGITFMNFGFYIRTHLGQALDDMQPPMPPGGGPPDAQYDNDTPLDNAYFAYLLMIIGLGIFCKAVFDYVRVRRLQAIIESSPEMNV